MMTGIPVEKGRGTSIEIEIEIGTGTGTTKGIEKEIEIDPTGKARLDF